MSRPKGSPDSSTLGTPEDQEIDLVKDDSSTSDGMTAGTSSNVTRVNAIARGDVEHLRNELLNSAAEDHDIASRDAVQGNLEKLKAAEHEAAAKKASEKAAEDEAAAKKAREKAAEDEAAATAKTMDALRRIRGSELRTNILSRPGAEELILFLSENQKLPHIFNDYCNDPLEIEWKKYHDEYTPAIYTQNAINFTPLNGSCYYLW